MTDTWCAVVPQKALSRAKGRLSLPVEERRLLAAAMLRDTVAALEATPSVGHVFVVWDDEADCRTVPETDRVHHVTAAGLGLNDAVELGAAVARQRAPGSPVAVVPSDLPALDPTELTTFLSRAGRFCRAFLADADANGTTMLAATGDFPLLPGYGPSSRELHEASGARDLTSADLPSLRRDVDDLASLDEAFDLGCGPHTVASVRALRSRLAELEEAG